MSVGDDGLHLLLGILRCLRIVASGEHSASGANLHDVGAVFDDLSRLVLHSRNAVCGSLRAGVSLERQQVVVTVAAGDPQRRAAHQHSRSRYEPLVDCVTQCHIAISAGSYVANGGKSGFERDLRITRSPKRFHRCRDPEGFVPEVGSLSNKMRVCIDQSGNERSSRQDNGGGAVGN